MISTRSLVLACLALVWSLWAVAAGAADLADIEARALTGVEQTFNGDYPDAIRTFDEIIDTDPEAPEGYFYKATSYLYWMQRDASLRRRLEGRFMELMGRAIERAEAILEKEPDSARAWFFIGGARGMRAQFNLDMGRYFRAAGDARGGKKALEKAAALDPTMVDVEFGLGTYNYYVDALPKVLGFFKHLLFIPNGNRELGLKQLWKAARKGRIGRWPALNMLWDIYAHYEFDVDKTIEVGEAMMARFPRNAWFPYWLGKTYVDGRLDLDRGEELFRRSIGIAEHRRPDSTPVAARAEGYAVIRLAQTLDRELGTIEAIDLLEGFLQTMPREPAGVQAAAQLELARMHARRGDEVEAELLWAAVDRAPDVEFDRGSSLNPQAAKGYSLHEVAARTRRALARETFKGPYLVEAQKGWAALRERAAQPALAHFEAARGISALADRDGVVLLGRGRALVELGRVEEALPLLVQAAAAPVAARWSWVRGAANRVIGEMHHRAGRQAEAAARFKSVLVDDEARWSDRRAAERGLAAADVMTVTPSVAPTAVAAGEVDG